MIKIKLNPKNTNKHTDEGMKLLEHSIDKVGVIESISVAEDGTIISGHARKEIFDKKGLIPKEIELADNEFAVIKTKIKPNSKEYYEAQILANTTAHKNYNLDTSLIEEIAVDYDIDVEELGVEVIDLPPDLDYSILDDEQLDEQIKEMANGVKKAIQIEFEPEHYEEAYALIKFWREQDAYVGKMILDFLKAEKTKYEKICNK